MYIRTKDGVYEFNKTFNGASIRIIYGNEIIKQSENLFELIDEFVVIRDSTKINQLVRTDNIEYLKEMIKEDKRIIAVKGAVWTDWGLKYLANVNKDGGLELVCT